MKHFKLWIVILAIVLSGNTHSIAWAQQMSLDEAIKLGLKNNPVLNQAQLEIKRSEAQLVLIWSEILPKVDLNAEKSRNHIFDYQFIQQGESSQVVLSPVISDRYDLNLTFNQKIIDMAFFSKLSGAINKMEAAKAQWQQQKSALAYEITEAYYLLMKADVIKHLIEMEIIAIEEYVKELKMIANLKYKSQQAVINIEMKLQDKRSMLYDQQQEYYVRKAAFARLISLPLTIDYSLASFETIKLMGIKPIPSGSVETMIDQAWEKRWDVISLQHQQSALREERMTKERAFLPKLYLQGSFGYLNTDQFDVKDEDEYWNINAGITYNLFNGFHDAASLGQARYQEEQAAQKIIELQRQLRSDIHSARYYIEVLTKAFEKAQMMINKSEEHFEIINQNVLMKQSTKEELLAAQLSFHEAKSYYCKSKIDLFVALEKYQYTLGQL